MHLSMDMLWVYIIVYLTVCTSREMVASELRLGDDMKTSDYVLLYIVCISIIYVSVGIMMNNYGWFATLSPKTKSYKFISSVTYSQ